jgi:N-acetylglutamate synthase-like GNAT family acetyltransferase
VIDIMVNTVVTFRPATQHDWPAIASLLEETRLPLDGARDHLDAYLLATIRGEIIGFAAAEVYGNAALLHSLAVASRLRHRGIGKALVTAVLQDLTDRQIANVCLLTVNASDYFIRFGFERVPIEQAPHAFSASAEFQGACPGDAVFMSLDLKSK